MLIYAIYAETGTLAAISFIADCANGWNAVPIDMDIPATYDEALKANPLLAATPAEEADVMGRML